MKITESHMEFGEFEESNVFHIEESSQYKLIKTHGVSCCEFILLRDDKLFLVEAKESCPRAVREGYPEGEKEKQLKNFRISSRKLPRKCGTRWSYMEAFC